MNIALDVLGGDLAPMAQIALLMLGEGQAYYQDKLLDGKTAFKRPCARVQEPVRAWARSYY